MRTVTIDQGWAWGVPIGGFIANFIVGGLAKSFGVIMGATQELLDANSAPLTLGGGLIYAFMYCLSLLSIFISEKYGCHLVIFIGSVGTVISFFAAFFVQSVWAWVAVIGGGTGISLSFIYSPIFVMVGRCFRKHVGIAMGISVAGVSVGQILFPSIISYVIDTYGARGSYIVGAGIVAHFFITGVLMPNRVIDPESDVKVDDVNENVKQNGSAKKSKKNKKEVEKIPLQDIPEASSEDLTSKIDTKKSEVANNEDFPPPTLEVEVKPAKSSLFSNFSKIQAIMLVLFIIAKVFGDVGDVGIAFALPLFGEQALGMTRQTISYAIAVAGGFDLISRIFIGYLSDRPWCRRSLLLLISWFIETINTFMFIWIPNVPAYFVFYGIFGMCSGTAITLMTVVLTDLVGQKNMPIGFALMMFTVGLFIAGGQFLVGFIADITGTYYYSMCYLGFNMLVAFLLLCLEYPVKFIIFNTCKSIASHSKDVRGHHNFRYSKRSKPLSVNNNEQVDDVMLEKNQDEESNCEESNRDRQNPNSRTRYSSVSSTLSHEIVELVRG